jgi:hypothetical protein
MQLCFALFEGQAENHLYVFPYDLNTHLTFIVSFSWSFVCVHLYVYNMVAKFLIIKIISSCPCFKFLWSQLTNAYIYDQDCVGACHLKYYSFVITYLLEDEQELSLGCLIRLKRIYNFWCSMFVFTPFAYYFITLRGTFMHFLELTY